VVVTQIHMHNTVKILTIKWLLTYCWQVPWLN